MRALKHHVQFPYLMQKMSLLSFLVEEGTLCSQTLQCSMFEASGDVCKAGEVTQWLHWNALRWPPASSPVLPEHCGFHFSNLFLGALQWLCCSPEAEVVLPTVMSRLWQLPQQCILALWEQRFGQVRCGWGEALEPGAGMGWMDGPARCGPSLWLLRWQLAFILYWNPQHGGQFCGWL